MSKDTVVYIRISTEEKETLKKLCEVEKMTMSCFLRKLINDYARKEND